MYTHCCSKISSKSSKHHTRESANRFGFAYLGAEEGWRGSVMPGGGGEGRLAGDAVTTMRAGATRSPRRGRGGDGSAGPAWAGETGRGGACREEQGRHGSARALGGKGEAQPGKMRRGGRRGHGAIPRRGGSGDAPAGRRSFAATEEGRRRRPPEGSRDSRDPVGVCVGG